jgi:hypothetical protein
MKKCHACGKLMKLPWSLCPYCGTPEPGKRREEIVIKEAVSATDVKVVEDELDDLDDEGMISEL